MRELKSESSLTMLFPEPVLLTTCPTASVIKTPKEHVKSSTVSTYVEDITNAYHRENE